MAVSYSFFCKNVFYSNSTILYKFFVFKDGRLLLEGEGRFSEASHF